MNARTHTCGAGEPFALPTPPICSEWWLVAPPFSTSLFHGRWSLERITVSSSARAGVAHLHQHCLGPFQQPLRLPRRRSPRHFCYAIVLEYETDQSSSLSVANSKYSLWPRRSGRALARLSQLVLEKNNSLFVHECCSWADYCTNGLYWATHLPYTVLFVTVCVSIPVTIYCAERKRWREFKYMYKYVPIFKGLISYMGE